MNRAERNLIFWTRLVGLEKSFPELAPPTEDNLASYMVTDEDQLQAINTSLATHQNTQVVIEPGWGCTTLFRYVVMTAQEKVINASELVLPVSIDLAAHLNKGSITSEGLEVEIKRQVIRWLLDNPWETYVNRKYYFECINYHSSAELAVHRANMLQFLSTRNLNLRQLTSRFPWLKGDLNEQLNYLLENLRMQTVLFLHFPRELGSQGVRDLIFAIKATTDRGRLDHAAWREVYFCNPQQRPYIGLDYERAFSVIKYPRYTHAQIFKMLVQRYQPKVYGSRSMNPADLGEVFSEEFVAQAWQSAQSLHDVVRRIRSAMLDRLDCPEDQVFFRLQPPGAPASAPEGPGAEPQLEPVPKPGRFVRNRNVGDVSANS